MKKARIYTKEEIELICNPKFSAKEVGFMLDICAITVYRKRKNLGVIIRGAKVGKPNPKKRRQVTRTCIGKDCSNTFTVIPSVTKKYCSHACQQRTANVAAKGIGSRKMRNPNTPEYKKYVRMVHGLSQKVYEKNIDIINPNRHPRTLCGVKGGWQLDHIVPIKECFEKGVAIEEASSIDNLRMLPWKKNLMRQYGISSKESNR
jgi:5-methylcytosine-specific restriction endonuclease McrA